MKMSWNELYRDFAKENSNIFLAAVIHHAVEELGSRLEALAPKPATVEIKDPKTVCGRDDWENFMIQGDLVLNCIRGRKQEDYSGFFAALLQELEKRIAGEYLWFPVSQKPPIRQPIEMTGESGYVAPHNRFVCSGYYDPEYRPLSPWLDSTSSCIEWKPTHWRYLTPEPGKEAGA